jgi:aspartate kinase
MARLVLKFGGTSVGDVARIKNVAKRVKKIVDAGNEVAVVVSAMSGQTDGLVKLVDAVSSKVDDAEYDVVVSTGELVTIGLVALALQDAGLKARSWPSWQLPIQCDDAHGKARITNIDVKPILEGFKRGEIAVVPGFQAMGSDGRIATLGRGGSDTSAVALAAALKADRCDIYTDVDGVYTADPRIVTKARKLDKITFEEMLESASLGAKVLQTRSVEMGMKHKVVVQVLSSFSDAPGTLVVDEEEGVEQELISSIAYSANEAKVTLIKVADRPGVAARIFGPLAEANINVDMIVQNVSEDGKSTDLTFTVPRNDLKRALAVIEGAKAKIGFEKVISAADVVKVSVVGVGMRSHAGIAYRMFQALADKGINIQTITTSEIKVSVLIAEEYTELALRTLHTAYGLDAA